MITVNRVNSAGMQAGTAETAQIDAVAKNIQNQIANAQKQLQELSSDEEMSVEEKMKKRQEIQQEIASLNQQLRQHQIEQRKEKQQKDASKDDLNGDMQKEAENQGTGLSQAGMQAMISADSSIKQAKVQGSTALHLEGEAGVLESEIKMDKGRGTDTAKKEEELARLKAKAESAATAQLSTLADAGKVMKKAAKEEREADKEDKDERTTFSISADGKQAAEKSGYYVQVDVRL